jgi:DNA polymerase-1
VLDLDLSIVPMVERMQSVGMLVDLDYLQDLAAVLQTEYDATVQMIARLAGKPLNPNSGDQVAEWLFDDMGLPWKKKTAGGRPETGKRTLEALSKNYDLPEESRRAVALVLEARSILKDKGFCESAREFTQADGRLHPRILLTRTGTGRAASKDPNMYAFPKHSMRGRLIRGGFVAGEGRMLAEWDLSQIDLRCLAIDSGDERMIEQFNSGHDFHTAGAASRFKKAPEDVTKDERFRQKKVNFAIPMGTTEHGLCDSFHQDGLTRTTVAECARLLQDWHRQYPQASGYIFQKHAQARRLGYVTTWTGRIRYLETVHSSDKFAKQEALRQAQATPIQGGARDIVKMWLAAIWQRLPAVWEQGLWVEPILDIHDSVLFELETAAYEPLKAVVEDALTSIQQFPIPISMEGSTGQSWGDL